MTNRTNIFIDTPWFNIGGVESFAINTATSFKDKNIILGLIISRNESRISSNEIDRIKQLTDVLNLSEFFKKVKNSNEKYILVLSWNIDVYKALTQHSYPNLEIISYLHNDAIYYYDRAVVYEGLISKFICVSEKIENRLKELLPSRASDICFQPCPTAISWTKERKKHQNPLTLAYIGRLEESAKGVSRLYPIYQALKEKNIDFQLRIIGRGPEETLLMEQFKNTPNVSFHQDIDSPLKVKEQLKTIDALLVTSNFEGGPLVVYEAMACGVVPISFHVGNVANIIDSGKNGYILKIGDLEGMVESVVKLDQDRALLSKMSLESLTCIEKKGYHQDSYNVFLKTLIQKMNKVSFSPNLDKTQKDLQDRNNNLVQYLEQICEPEAIRKYQIIEYLKEYRNIAKLTNSPSNYEVKRLNESIEWYENTYEKLPLWWKKVGALIRRIRK